MLYSASYVIHLLSSVVFAMLLFLPVRVWQWKGQAITGAGSEAGKSGISSTTASKFAVGPFAFWLNVTRVAHLFLILVLGTGLLLTPSFGSSWFWVVMAVFVALGAFLGITSKTIRLLKQAVSSDEANVDLNRLLSKLAIMSLLLSATVVVLFVLMFVRW